MNKKIKKAIIPAAGLGTRFLPATKSMPKEMLPIIDIPTIQLIVEEAASSGIEEILIITSPTKHSIENHFDYNFELEKRLEESNKNVEVKMIRDIADIANIHYVRQKEPKGLGHAIHCAKAFVGNEDFAILLGDDVVVNDDMPALKQLIDAYDKTGHSILGVQHVHKQDVNKYGVINPTSSSGKLHELKGIVEKPECDEAPSTLAVLGRYILSNNIFDILEKQKPGKGNEIQLTDAIEILLSQEKVYALEFDGERYDVGDKFGFIKATIDFALKRDDLKDDVYDYIKKLI